MSQVSVRTPFYTSHTLLLCEPLGAGFNQLHAPNSRTNKWIRRLFSRIGNEPFDTHDDRRALHGDHLRQQCLCALGCSTAQMAFAALGTNQGARPGKAESFGCRFMGFQLDLSSFHLSGHNKLL